ncbi:patatin-like phospholipase family protein [Schlesneria sp. T3-172]|uniref:patatin-like phospholipase family protein n=1 Tax=Schlesneria sphaerica TaxID=3373610 RepID=UPI0037CB4B53
MRPLDTGADFDSNWARGAWTWIVIALSLCLSVGCATPHRLSSPTAAGIKPADLVDTTADGLDGTPPLVFRQLFAQGERVRESQKPKVLPPKKTALVLSGGGSYGAYTAGILCGWTESGTRPQFDVVTGVSTGALIAIFAFLGPEYDQELRRNYTMVRSRDIYRRKHLPWALFTDSLNDSKPLLRQIEANVTPEVVQKIADSHNCGRRLYIGTTDVEGRRPVVWDLGAIAASDRPDRRALICKLLLASAAIPGFFPTVEIPVVVNGKQYIERHVDGGLTQPLFFRPPALSEDQYTASSLAELLYGSDEYVIVAGKLYADPHPVTTRVLNVVGDSVSIFLYAQTRDALVKLYMQSLLTGMQYHLAAVPGELEVSKSAADFDSEMMTTLFEEGRRQVLAGTAWRHTPPGMAGGEELLQRAGTTLEIVPQALRTLPQSMQTEELPLPDDFDDVPPLPDE